MHSHDVEAIMSIFSLRLDHGERISDMFNVRPVHTHLNSLFQGLILSRCPMCSRFIRVLIPF